MKNIALSLSLKDENMLNGFCLIEFGCQIFLPLICLLQIERKKNMIKTFTPIITPNQSIINFSGPFYVVFNVFIILRCCCMRRII